jgi:hypothetical protein
MCGSETLTTVVSSTSIKVLVITAIATSQGLKSLHDREAGSVCVTLAMLNEQYVDARGELRETKDNQPEGRGGQRTKN